METSYDCLHDLLKANHEAYHYFASLPQYVRESIASRAESVNTYSGLRDYAENLLRGDI